MKVQVVTDPLGRLLWASPALSGAVHDVRAARTHGIVDALTAAGVKCWAASRATREPVAPSVSCSVAAGRTCPLVSRPSTASHAQIRALVERAMATLWTGRLLRKLRCSATRILPRAEAFGQVRPGKTGSGPEEPPIGHRPVIAPPAATPPARRQQRPQLFPLRVRQVIRETDPSAGVSAPAAGPAGPASMSTSFGSQRAISTVTKMISGMAARKIIVWDRPTAVTTSGNT